jgi:lysozyme
MPTYAELIVAAEERVAREQAELKAAQDSLTALLAKQVGPGIDVSTADVNWQTLAGAGYDFAFVKTSDGDVRTDQYTAARVTAIRAAGIPFGPYHFMRVGRAENFNRNGREEAGMAIFFARQRGWGLPGDLPLALDVETLNGQAPDKAALHVVQFVNAYEWLMGHLPVIYTNPGTWNQLAPQFTATQAVKLGQCPLWVADWTDPLEFPLTWMSPLIHQYQGDVSGVAGVTGLADLNRFLGSTDDLEALRLK